MVRLTRKNIKVFADSADNNGVFGSLQAGNPTVSNDVETLQSLSAWNYGWNSATMTSEKLPPLEEIQGVTYVTTYQQAYIMQEGLPEWASTVTYFHGSLVKKVTANGFQIYNSLTDNNEGNQLSDTTNWKLVMDSDNLYAMDDTVVHLAGTETITGAKTFTEDVDIRNKWIRFKTDKIAYTETPSGSNVYWGFSCLDKNNAEVSAHYTVFYQDGTALAGFNLKNHSGEQGRLKLQFNTSGDFYATCPAPSQPTNAGNYGEQIVNIGWVNDAGSAGNNLVHKTGDESITGRKNFVGGYNNVRLSCTTNDTSGDDAYTDIAFYNNSGSTKNAYIRADNAGNLYLSATDAVTAPASDKANSLLTTVAKSKAQNGYFKLGNGLIVQWGYATITSSEHTKQVKMPIAFTSTNYTVIVSRLNHEFNANVVAVQTDNYRTQYFDFTSNDPAVHWLAVGY